MKEAVKIGDFKAFKEARRRYIGKGYGYTNFMASVKYMDPVEGVGKKEEERDFLENFLTPAQRDKVHVARMYAKTLQDGMWVYWREAAKSDTAEEQAKFKEQINREMVNALVATMESKELTREQKEARLRQLLEKYQVTPQEARRIHDEKRQADLDRQMEGRGKPKTRLKRVEDGRLTNFGKQSAWIGRLANPSQ
jgi:septal ring factor EnvC (AmiA/AmiB activator)